MEQHSGFRLYAPHRHEEGVQSEVRCLTALYGPADNSPGVQVNDDSQIGKALNGHLFIRFSHSEPSTMSGISPQGLRALALPSEIR